MSRQPACGIREAKHRARVARMYLEVAEIAADEELDEARNVASGNAVLAAIAAADAICCARLGKRSRAQAHDEALALVSRVEPDGTTLARDLATVLGVKDPSHYGTVFVGASKLKSTMRAAARLVTAAEDALAAR